MMLRLARMLKRYEAALVMLAAFMVSGLIFAASYWAAGRFPGLFLPPE